jgi:transposase
MSLKPTAIEPVPTATAQVARAAFPRGNVYLILRDALGTVFTDADFADLYPHHGQPGLPPWRLALVTVLQFRENLSDRQAAEAVRARIDWKYLLGLELTDPGFNYSVLSEFRARVSTGDASERFLEKLLTHCQAQGLLRAGGRQRTDATHVLAAVRVLNRLELVAETLRAALNAVAAAEPAWLTRHVPQNWYQRYSRRIEYSRRPSSETERQTKTRMMGEDGMRFLAWLDEPDAPAHLRELPEVRMVRRGWQRHYRREPTDDDNDDSPGTVRFTTKEELADNHDPIETPYDGEARYRNKRGLDWIGYAVHLSETCDEEQVHLITHVKTTPANIAEAKCTAAIQQALVAADRAPNIHLADAGYIAADLLVQSQAQHGIRLVGPVRDSARWQHHVEGAYALEQFTIDWATHSAYCPQGHRSASWYPFQHANGHHYIRVTFAKEDCAGCPQRARCTRAKTQPRSLQLQPQPQQAAIDRMRAYLESEEGRRLYAKRAGIEGTLSQGVRAFGLRRSRYIGLAKTHLQQVASAAALNLDRLATWFMHRPRAQTRVSRFAALAG